MIERNEVDAKSAELAVHTSNVQRDYAFGWLLSSLYEPHNPLHEILILKGGNCFRKAYFEHARYSNDLDFSTQCRVDPDLLLDGLRQACTVARERSGIQFLVDESRVSEKHMADDSRLFDARVYFESFYGDEDDFRLRVNLDVKEFDSILLPLQTRRLIHSYSDWEQCQADLRCFKLEELLAAKLRALLQRRHSPDLYDFVHSLFFQKSLAISRLEVLRTFLKQTVYEPDPSVAKGLLLELPFEVIRGFWADYLACPKPSVFSFDDAKSWFMTLIEDLFALIQPTPALAGRAAMGSFYRTAQRDVILEAGRLRRLLKVSYDGHERVVEPYSLAFKRRQDGVAGEYFYVWDRTGGRSRQVGIKSFFADKLQSVTMLEEHFEPKYPIELAKDSAGYFAQPFSSASPRKARVRDSHSRGKNSAPFGARYTIECPVCAKRFTRSKYDTRLNEHRDKFGNRCFGRIGYLV